MKYGDYITAKIALEIFSIAQCFLVVIGTIYP